MEPVEYIVNSVVHYLTMDPILTMGKVVKVSVLYMRVSLLCIVYEGLVCYIYCI